MPSYQLVYFNIRARAEVARMLFGVAGVEFEEERIEIADWAGRKGSKLRDNCFILNHTFFPGI